MKREPQRRPGLLGCLCDGHALVFLPLCLAIFALSLQVSSRRAGVEPVSLPGLTEEQGALGALSGLPTLRKGERRSKMGGRLARLLSRDFVSDTASSMKVPEDWRIGAGFEPEVQQDASRGGGSLPKVAFMTTTADTFEQIRVWVQYHTSMGVSLFILFVDGQAAQLNVMIQLRGLPGVVVVPRTPALVYRQDHSRIWNESWLAAFFHKPCNHHLFVRQSLNMEEGIKLARAEGAEWVMHVDTDELLYPGGASHYSFQTVLAAIPARVDNVIFPNYESLPERDDVRDPFTEVSLFKRNFHHVAAGAYYKAYKTVSRGNPNYFITYGNGKSAARVVAGLRPNGAHRWFNYNRRPVEMTHDSAAVLHYTYNRFSDLKSRRDRCDCAPTETDAQRCFILPFDRNAFLAASLKTDSELMMWFRERLVWSEPPVVKDLVKSGLFYRIYTPQVLIRGFAAMNDRSDKEVSQLADSSKEAAKTKSTAASPGHVISREDRSGSGSPGNEEGITEGDALSRRRGAAAVPGALHSDPRFELADELQVGSVDNRAEPLGPAAQHIAGGGALFGAIAQRSRSNSQLEKR